MNNQRQIAETIMCQITTGDAWCLAACGARDYMTLDANEDRRGGLMFRVTINPRLFHKIIIELTHLDEYKVILWGGRRKCVEGKEIESREAWCDTLAETVYELCNPR
jgi:hypothetical protein